MARELAAAGFCVIAVARKSTPELASAADEAKAAGRGAIEFRAADLAQTEQLGAIARDLRREFGPLHGLVNNAGLGTSGVLGVMLDVDIERLLHLNTLSPILLTKYVARGMMSERAGRIVNVSSIVASTGYNGLSVYSATKAALLGFTRSLARELGSFGITVNAVAPGFIATEMTEEMTQGQRDQIVRRSALKRLAEPVDVARTVAFLIGDAGRNITGTVLTVDAGNTA